MAVNPVLVGVSVDHVATPRQLRSMRYHDPVYAARRVRYAGADAMRVHLREDGLTRHVLRSLAAKPRVTEFNAGHARIADAFYGGLARAITDFERVPRQARVRAS